MTERSTIAPWDTWTWEIRDDVLAPPLADAVERSTADLLASIAPFSKEAFAAPGVFDRWSGHDLLAHCLSWAELCAKVLQEMVAGTLNLDDYRHLPMHDESEEDLNQRWVGALRDATTEEMIERLERARDLAADALRRLQGDPPVMLVHMTFGYHFDDHAEAFRKAAGV